MGDFAVWKLAIAGRTPVDGSFGCRWGMAYVGRLVLLSMNHH